MLPCFSGLSPDEFVLFFLYFSSISRALFGSHIAFGERNLVGSGVWSMCGLVRLIDLGRARTADHCFSFVFFCLDTCFVTPDLDV